MCNNTQKKKAAGAGKDFTLFFGVMLHFNFKCEEAFQNIYKEFSAGFVTSISIYDDHKYFYRYLQIPRIFPRDPATKVQKQSNSPSRA